MRRKKNINLNHVMSVDLPLLDSTTSVGKDAAQFMSVRDYLAVRHNKSSEEIDHHSISFIMLLQYQATSIVSYYNIDGDALLPLNFLIEMFRTFPETEEAMDDLDDSLDEVHFFYDDAESSLRLSAVEFCTRHSKAKKLKKLELVASKLLDNLKLPQYKQIQMTRDAKQFSLRREYPVWLLMIADCMTE